MKKNFFLCFFLTLIILYLSFYIVGFLTFRTFITSDLGAQYYHFLYMFKEVLDGTSNLFYSFKIGIGNSFYDIFLYYLNSPINLLIKFFSYDNIYNFLLFTILIKISLCSSTMYLYMQYHFKNDKHLIFFSICYGLSSAIIGNYLQIMWLDSYIIAPLVLLGIDKLINEEKTSLYVFSLAFCIFSNYYMGYIICFFVIMYFIYRLLLCHANKKKITLNFLIMSLLAGLMTMVTNLTGLIDILNLNRSNNLNFGFNTNPTAIFSSLFIWNNNQENILNYTSPRIYISIILFIFILIYFFNKNTLKKEKIISGFFIFIFLIFMLFEPFNSIWHAFVNPIGFNFRYAFLIDIFLIYISYKGFKNINYIERKYYFLILYLILILFFCCYFVDYINIKYIYLSLIFVLIYLILLYLKKYYFLFIFLFVELFLNATIYYKDVSALLNSDLMINDQILEQINYIKNIDSDVFYRMDFFMLDEIAYNDNILYNYSSMSSFVSTIPSNWINFFNNVGYEVSKNSYLFRNYDIINSILGIKYYADTKGHDKIIGIYGENYIYKNENALSLGFVVSDNVKKEWKCETAFECQEKIINLMNNNDNDIFVDVPVKEISEYEYQIEVTQDEYKYLSIIIEYENKMTAEVYLNDKLSGIFTDLNGNVLKTSSILNNEYDEPLTLKIVDKNNSFSKVTVKEYLFDYNVYLNEINKLKKNQLNIEIFKDDYIKGTIDGSGTVFFSIPYSNYWNVYVDGQKVNTFQIFDMFLGIDIKEGNHTIELKYEINSFNYGFLISVTSFIVYLAILKRKNNIKINDKYL